MKQICCLCKKEFEGFGNNPQGVIDDIIGDKCVTLKKFKEGDVCCDKCNESIVIPHRAFVVLGGWRIKESE